MASGDEVGDGDGSSGDEPPTMKIPKSKSEPTPETSATARSQQSTSGQPPPLTPQQLQEAAERRESLWMSMGIHRKDDGATSIRRRRMSKHRESLELNQLTQVSQPGDLADLGQFESNLQALCTL